MKRLKLSERTLPAYSKGEEIVNMITHIVGGAMGFIALIMCVVFASMDEFDGYALAGAIVFGISMICLYTMSSVYHGLKPTLLAKKVFQVIDHCTIFVLIAGTYTPILLTKFREFNPTVAWTMFIVIWGFAILGMVLNSIDLKKYKTFSMISYLAMGWCVIFTAKDLVTILGLPACLMLIAGGLSYTIGAMLYIYGHKKKKPYFHSLFHIFCIIGSLVHFLCIVIYII